MGAESYEEFSDVLDMHKFPRFGYSTEISKLVSQDLSRQDSYKNGIIISATFFFVILIIWIIVLLILRYRGSHTVGCGAGRIEENTRAFTCQKKLQAVFLLFWFLLFLGIVLLFSRGVSKLKIAATETLELNADIRIAIYEGFVLANSTITTERRLNQSSIDQSLNLNAFCANTELLNGTYYDSIETITSTIASVQAYFTKHEIPELKEDLSYMIESSDHLKDILVKYEENDWIAKMYAVFLGDFSLFLFGVAALNLARSAKPRLTAMISYVVLPSFCFLIVMGWAVFCIFTVGSVMNADYCHGGGVGPTQTIHDGLLEHGIKQEELTFQSFVYYNNSCIGKNPWDDIASEYGLHLTLGIEATNSLLLHLESNVTNTSCKDNELQESVKTLNHFNNDIQLLREGLEKAMELARCGRILPLYNRVFRGSACKESIVGLSWCFASFFLICISGMFMISLRAAVYPISPSASSTNTNVESVSRDKRYRMNM